MSWVPRDNARNWLSLASSADGTQLVAAVDSGQIYTNNLSSSLSGAQGSVAVLRYVGNGLWAATEESQIAAGAVGTAQLAVNSVQTGNIANGAVTNSQLGTSAVTTVNIADSTVTNAKLATDAVNTTNIVNGAVTNAKLATNAVTTTNIVNGAVTSAKLDPSIAGGLWGLVGGDAYRGTGKVGIGGTPLNLLDVQGTGISPIIIARSTTVGSANQAALIASRGDQANGYAQVQFLTAGANGYAIGLRAADANLHFYDITGGADRMIMTPGGNFGIGAGASASQAQLEVKGASSGNVLIGQWAQDPVYGFISLNNANTSGGYSFLSSPVADHTLYINRPTGGGIVFRENNGPDQMAIATGGNVGIGTDTPTHLLHVNGVARSTQSTWATSSDARVKEDIQSLSGSLEKLKALRPVSFEYTKTYRADHPGLDGTFTGFVAQEVEPIFPDMVSTVPEEVGNETVKDFHLLNVSGLLPHVVAGVQTLEAENEALRKRADELEKRIRQLEAALPKSNRKATTKSSR